ncbi:MAG TPA: hypothetical protein VHE83_00075 [Mycobacteriales bacterium]|nr:hypothetical protein [Mycobacteriales bacterium]
MALDVFFTPAVDGPTLAAAIRPSLPWQVGQRGRLRKQISQLIYDNDDTGVAFTVDREAEELSDGSPELSPFNARINLGRPSFYGQEAIGALMLLARDAGAELVLLDEEQRPRRAALDELLDAWSRGNASAWAAVDPTRSIGVPVAREDADAWWQWQMWRARRERELEELAFVPRLFLLRRGGGPAIRAWTWPGGQAQAIPDGDVVLCPVDGGGMLLLTQDEARSIVAGLTTTITCRDRGVVTYVPIEHDAAVKARFSSSVAGRRLIASSELEAVSADRLRDC